MSSLHCVDQKTFSDLDCSTWGFESSRLKGDSNIRLYIYACFPCKLIRSRKKGRASIPFCEIY